MTETITLAGGCFWCLEAVFKRLRGIEHVQSGYCGGTVPHPSYKEVCTGTTGHAQAIQISFDKSIISLNTILEIFWKLHNPTTLNKQDYDIGTQYRSAIFYSNEDQKKIILESLETLKSNHTYSDPIVTEIAPLEIFYPAEEYHNDYFDRNREQGYCRLIIDPKIEKLYKDFKDKIKE